MKKGDIVTPRDFPELKGTIIWIDRDYANQDLYVLDNGCRYTESEVDFEDMRIKKINHD